MRADLAPTPRLTRCFNEAPAAGGGGVGGMLAGAVLAAVRYAARIRAARELTRCPALRAADHVFGATREHRLPRLRGRRRRVLAGDGRVDVRRIRARRLA